MYNLEDIARNIVLSKSTKRYMRKIKDKTLFDDDNYYVNNDEFIKIINRGASNICKKLKKVIHKKNITSITGKTINDNDNDINLVDIDNNVFIFMGESVFVMRDNDNNPWFKGSDISIILKYDNPEKALKNHVSNRKKMPYSELKNICPSRPSESNGREGQGSSAKNGNNETLINNFSHELYESTLFINEYGLYSLVLKSKTKKAIKFQDWITDDLLPSIRKYGGYISTKNHNYAYLYDIKDHDDKFCVYIGRISDKDNVYKYGRTKHMAKRINSHSNIYDAFVIIRIYNFDNDNDAATVERKIKELVKDNDIRTTKRYHKLNNNAKTEAELFKPNDEYTLSDLKLDIDTFVYNLKNKGDILINNDDNDDNDDSDDNDYIEDNDYVDHETEQRKQYPDDTYDRKLQYLKFLIDSGISPEDFQKYGDIYDNFIKTQYTSEKELLNKRRTAQQDRQEIQVEQSINEDTITETEEDIDNEQSKQEVEVKTKPKTKKKKTTKKFKKVKKVKKVKNECIDCDKIIDKRATRCADCNTEFLYRKNVEESARPSVEVLKKEVKETSYKAVGRKYGVSDNSIRKWIKKGEKYKN